MADYINRSFYSFVSLQSASFYLYYIKFGVHGVKTYGINGKEALTGDWEELNK